MGGGGGAEGAVGPTSQVISPAGGGGGAIAGPAAEGPQVAVGTAVLASIPGAANVCSSGASPPFPECLLVGARVRWRAARTLRSICPPRAQDIDFSWTPFWRMTKITHVMPHPATSRPA